MLWDAVKGFIRDSTTSDQMWDVYWDESCPGGRAERFPLDGPAAKSKLATFMKTKMSFLVLI